MDQTFSKDPFDERWIAMDNLLAVQSWDESRLAPRMREPMTTHSVFSRVVNLRTDDGELFSLVSAELDDAPRTLRLAPQQVIPALRTGERVHLIKPGRKPVPAPAGVIGPELPGSLGTESGLDLGLDLHAAVAWSPEAIPIGMRGVAALHGLAGALDRRLAVEGVRGGVLGPAPHAGPVESAVAARLLRATKLLSSAISNRRAVDGAVLSLLGLGPGLTPSGDDYLAGLALVSASPGSGLSDVANAVLRIVAHHRQRTTELSAVTIREAAEGRAAQSLLDLLHAGLPEPPARGAVALSTVDLDARIHAPLLRVLRIGHSSGSDLVSGIIAGLRAAARRRACANEPACPSEPAGAL
ncbi:oxamate carbamoyltransferase subunit AllH family protein [Leucobacter sp. GX24907]